MPKLMRFSIENFKGIKSTKFTVDEKSISDVVTLIGLNESGKTTVLEALSHFSTGDRTIPNLLAQGEQKEHLISLIPIDQRANFTGNISIVAEILLTEEEMKRYAQNVSKLKNVDILVNDGDCSVQIEKRYSYEDSLFLEQQNFWNGVSFKHKTKRAHIYKKMT